MKQLSFAAVIIVGFLAGAAGAGTVLLGNIFKELAQDAVPALYEAPISREFLAADNYEQQVIQTVDQATPAVVSIIISKDVPIVERYYKEVPGINDPFGNFFGSPFSSFGFRVPQYRQLGTEQKEIGGGSGFLVSSDGLIVTNRHVVDQTDVEYTVFTNDGQSYEATVLARDSMNDIAVVKIGGENLPFLQFGNSDELKVGQTVISIGNALSEFRNTVSLGVISGLLRSIVANGGAAGPEQLDEVIQTDAAINPGNSGGPLVDLKGQVVGVNVAVVMNSQNIGFALPANLVKSAVEDVQEQGKISHPYLGVRYVPVTPMVMANSNLSVDYGILITPGNTSDALAVAPGSPADKAGLIEGDVILELNKIKIDNENSLASLLRKQKVGDEVQLKVLRQGSEIIVPLTLEATS